MCHLGRETSNYILRTTLQYNYMWFNLGFIGQQVIIKTNDENCRRKHKFVNQSTIEIINYQLFISFTSAAGQQK